MSFPGETLATTGWISIRLRHDDLESLRERARARELPTSTYVVPFGYPAMPSDGASNANNVVVLVSFAFIAETGAKNRETGPLKMRLASVRQSDHQLVRAHHSPFRCAIATSQTTRASAEISPRSVVRIAQPRRRQAKDSARTAPSRSH
jgi:hypothetical protein